MAFALPDVACGTFIAIGMAIQTGVAFPDIVADIIVLVIHLRLTVFVTMGAGEVRNISAQMTVCTAVPLVSMFARVDGEVKLIVIELCIVPVTGVMAVKTGFGKAGGLMIRVVGTVVIVLMTEETVGGCARVLAINVTRNTADAGMRAGQREIRVVVIEVRIIPVTCVVTHGTVMVELLGDMIRVVCSLVIGLMTGPAV